MSKLQIIIYVISITYLIIRIFSDIKTETLKNARWLKIGLPINLILTFSIILAGSGAFPFDVKNHFSYLLVIAIFSAIQFHIYSRYEYGHHALAIVSIVTSFLIFGYSAMELGRTQLFSTKNVSIEISGVFDDRLSESIGNIRQSLSSVEKAVETEKEKIDEISIALIKDLKRQQSEIKNLEVKKKEAEKKLEYYKSMSSLTEEQVSAIQYALESKSFLGRASDVFIGLLVGLFANYLSPYLKRKGSFKPNS